MYNNRNCMDKNPTINIDTLTRLLLASSRAGIEFWTPTTTPHPIGRGRAPFGQPFYPLHSHPYIELIYRLEGTPAICLNGIWTRYDNDKLKIFTPGTRHTEHFTDERKGYHLLWNIISKQSLMVHLTAYIPAKGYVASTKCLAFTPPMVNRLWDASMAPDLASSPRRQVEFHYLLMECVNYCVQNEALFHTGAENFQEHVIDHLTSYLNEHYCDEITLEGLASMFHYSPKHLNVLFRKAKGLPLLQHVGTLRMQKARAHLASGSMLVKQAAEAVGIHDPLYFSRKFRQHFGRPPQDFIPRRKHPQRSHT